MTSEIGHEAMRQNLEQYISERHGWLEEARVLLAEDPSHDLETVLAMPISDPTKARADEAAPALRAEDEQALREIAGRFGIGGEADVVSTAEHHILEGGKPWKMEAEAKPWKTEEETPTVLNARTVIFAGSSYRKLGQDEVDYMRVKYGFDLADATEYDMVGKVAETLHGFVLTDEKVLPFGYEVSDEHTFLTHGEGKQLRKVGEVKGVPVLLLRVDGETFKDDQGVERQRYRPNSADLMGFIGQVLAACGDETSRVALDTSTTYAARAIDTVRAGLRYGRVFEIGMYGRQTLADIKGEPVATASELQNIPGELRVAHDMLVLLEAELATQAN